MSKHDDGGPAFPAPGVYGDENVGHQQLERGELGMALRDYFAASAMVGVLSGRAHAPGASHSPKSIARFAYEMADAMLLARAEDPS